jgi:hypothetical protein
VSKNSVEEANAASEASKETGIPRFPTFLIVLGSLLMFTFLYLQIKEVSAASFSTARGEVVSTEAVQIRKHRGQLPAQWEARVRYKFKVGDREFLSSRWGPRGEKKIFLSKQSAEVFLNDFPKNMWTIIRYDPADPERCYLKLLIDYSPLKLGILCSLMVIWGIWSLLVTYRSRKKTANPPR